MKGITLGRLELLGWMNEVCETDYPRVELCADGVSFCQIFDAIHPGVIQLAKLNFNAKFEDDCARNLKILEDGFKKLGVKKLVPVSKLAKGKFQDNMEFLQWLYGYSVKIAPTIAKTYEGYQRRIEAYCKQRGIRDPSGCPINMSSHLILNKTQIKNINEDGVASLIANPEIPVDPPEEAPSEGNELNNQRRLQLLNLITSLEYKK